MAEEDLSGHDVAEANGLESVYMQVTCTIWLDQLPSDA